MKAPLHTTPVTNNAAQTVLKNACVWLRSHYDSRYTFLQPKWYACFFLHLSRKCCLFGESHVNANDWGRAGTFRLMLICLRFAPRMACTLIWSLTSKDKQRCKSALPQSMSFLEVFLPLLHPHVHLYGPGEGGNRELGNQIYWHFFKEDSWREEGSKVRKSVSLFTCWPELVVRGFLCLDCINPSVSTCYRAFINVVF